MFNINELIGNLKLFARYATYPQCCPCINVERQWAFIIVMYIISSKLSVDNFILGWHC